MKDGLNPGWHVEGTFLGTFSGYIVEGARYISPDNEIGWHTKSWPMRDPIHEFWISDAKLYRVKVPISEFRAVRVKIEIFEEIKNVDPAERKAILEAIEAWEKQVAEVLAEAEKTQETDDSTTH